MKIPIVEFDDYNSMLQSVGGKTGGDAERHLPYLTPSGVYPLGSLLPTDVSNKLEEFERINFALNSRIRLATEIEASDEFIGIQDFPRAAYVELRTGTYECVGKILDYHKFYKASLV